MPHSKKLVLAVIVLLAIAALIIAYVVSPSSFLFSIGGPTIVTPGWEIYDQIVGAQQGNTLYNRSSQFTTPNFISAPYWKFDVDNPNFGVPTMEVTVSDIEHVDFSGTQIPSDQPAHTFPSVTRGNNTYLMDEHIYMFTVTIRSVADVVHTGDIGIGLTVPYFQHETSWGKCYSSGSGNSGGTEYGKPFDGGAYIAFVIDPWRGPVSDNSVSAPANYTIVNAWAGVMNAYVLSKKQGQVPNQYKDSNNPDNNNGLPTPSADAEPQIKGAIEPGFPVPMFLDDDVFSTSAPKVTFDSQVNPDIRIQSTVALYLPIYIFPGAALYHDWLGNVQAIYPADQYIMYNVRVDVLQTHNFTLQTAVNPPTPQAPSDYYGWAQDWWTSFLHGLDPFAFLGPLEPLVWWLVTAGIVLLIIFVLIAVFGPWVLPRLARTTRSTYKAAKGE